jgi:hypothetical protein
METAKHIKSRYNNVLEIVKNADIIHIDGTVLKLMKASFIFCVFTTVAETLSTVRRSRERKF